MHQPHHACSYPEDPYQIKWKFSKNFDKITTYQTKETFTRNLNVIFIVNFKIFVDHNFDKTAKIHVGYQIEENFNQNIQNLEIFKILGQQGPKKDLEFEEMLNPAGSHTKGTFNPNPNVSFTTSMNIFILSGYHETKLSSEF